MKPECQVSAYRAHLLDRLRERAARQRHEELGSLRVVVNHAGVGTLECEQTPTTWVYADHQHPVRDLELRSESGLLVGALFAPSVGPRVARFSAGSYRIEVSLDNGLHGGSVRIACRPAVPIWSRIQTQLLSVASQVVGFGSRSVQGLSPLSQAFGLAHRSGWSKTLMLAQIVVAGAVVFLVADRFAHPPADSRSGFPASTPSGSARGASSPEEIRDRLEKTVGQLAEGQEAAARKIKTQQQDLAQLRQSVMTMEVALDSRLSSLAADRQRLYDEVLRLTVATDQLSTDYAELSAHVQVAAADQEHLRGEVRQMTATDDVLSRDVAVLQARAQVAAARLETTAQPFKFWVSFQDGTPDKSIEALIQEIKGRKGPLDAGWYSVEVNLPQAQTPDSFVESLKKASIVKAVRTSLSAGPAQ